MCVCLFIIIFITVRCVYVGRWKMSEGIFSAEDFDILCIF